MTKINPNKIKESFIDENGKYHREDGPAVTKHGGEQRWYRHGKLHRDGGPALISPIEGTDKMFEEWYQNGKIHREDGPARIDPTRHEWYRKGVIHRENGPAVSKWFRLDKGVVGPLQEEQWWTRGRYGRADGPSTITYSYNAPNRVFEELWASKGEKHRTDGPAYVRYDDEGRVVKEQWCQEGKLHRNDGPAVIERDHTCNLTKQMWYNNGNRHREGAPAHLEIMNGEVVREEWYIHGKECRIGGPAVWMNNPTYFHERWTEGGGFETGGLARRDDIPVERRIHKIKGIIENTWCFTDGSRRYTTDSPKRYEDKWFRGMHLHREDGPAFTKINRRTMEKEFIWAFHGMEFVSPDGEMPKNFPKDATGLKNLNQECLQDIMMIASIIERNPLLKGMNASTLASNIKLAREHMKTEEGVVTEEQRAYNKFRYMFRMGIGQMF